MKTWDQNISFQYVFDDVRDDVDALVGDGGGVDRMFYRLNDNFLRIWFKLLWLGPVPRHS